MKDVFTIKFRLTLMKSYLNIDVDFAKDFVDNCGAFGAVMSESSKAFDCLQHEL